MAAEITLTINQQSHTVFDEPNRMLLTVLRDEMGLTGSKYGCGEGQCGSCTVLVDDVPRRSCITPLRALNNKAITTIEGIAQDGTLHPLQEAFIEKEAMQCAYCTSGMIVSGVGLLKKNTNPSRDEIIEFMQGNICRCGTYTRIIDAIQTAAASMQEVR